MTQSGESPGLVLGGLVLAGLTGAVLASRSRPATGRGLRDTKVTRSIAAHEAGHAVAAQTFGYRVTSIKLSDSDNDGIADGGITSYEGKFVNWERLCVAFAGFVAEQSVTGRFSAANAATDFSVASQICAAISAERRPTPWRRVGGFTVSVPANAGTSPECCRIANEAASYARSIVRRNNGALVAVRDALMAEVTMDADRVAAVFAPHQLVRP